MTFLLYHFVMLESAEVSVVATFPTIQAEEMGGKTMFWTISVIFLSLWLLGVSTPSTLHGYIHIFLALAVATTVLPLLRRKKNLVD
jgi:hypothetical protein